MRHAYDLPDLVIANAATDSNELTHKQFGGCRGFTIQAPATLPETVNVEVSLDGTTFAVLVSGVNDVAVGAGDAVVIDWGGWDAIRVGATASVAAERTFLIKAVRDY